MKTQKLLHATCVAFIATLYLPIAKPSVEAQDGNRFSTTIQMEIDGDNNQSRHRTSKSGIMDPIALFRNEQIGVNLIVPPNMVNSPVGIAPLDGGEIIASANLTVNNDRAAHFSFTGGETRGLYRVLVTIASEQYQLQFYVLPTEPDSICVEP